MKKDLLKRMLKNLIDDRFDEATAEFNKYISQKAGEVSGLREDDGKKKPTKTLTDIKFPDLNGSTGGKLAANQKHLNAVSAGQTTKAVGNIRPNASLISRLASLGKNVSMDDTDTDAVPQEPHKPETLPAVISHEMRVAGYLEPDWHLVANLPGNMSAQIRQLGKVLFKTFTKTPTDKITMVANVMGQGPNSSSEINAVVAYLKKNGENLGPGNIDFDNIMPGYTADIHEYRAAGIHFMLVKDEYGQYIYSWPEGASLHSSKVKTLR